MWKDLKVRIAIMKINLMKVMKKWKLREPLK